jgi:hypothetical protein
MMNFEATELATENATRVNKAAFLASIIIVIGFIAGCGKRSASLLPIPFCLRANRRSLALINSIVCFPAKNLRP